MFQEIAVYMQQTRNERRLHLKLDVSCIEIGGGSQQFRGLLAHHLKTTISTKRESVLCHACHNSKCSNVLHLYWGTDADNFQDQQENGTAESVNTRTKRKYGADVYAEMHRKASALGGKSGGGKNKFNDLKLKDLTETILRFEKKRGYISAIAKELNVSHTQVKRYFKLLGL